MKKITAAFLGLTALLVTGMAQAEIIHETYTYSGQGSYNADSVLTPGEFVLFSFDLENAGGGIFSTPPSFALSQDATGAVTGSDGWLGGSLSIDLLSIDPAIENTAISAVAYGPSGVSILALDNFVWSRNSQSNPTYTATYEFTAADLSLFQQSGVASLVIFAPSNAGFYNDFAISRVDMAIDVPEPAMFSLLGLGLLGFGFARRARKAA